MSFEYKNPISPEQLNGVQSVSRSQTFGTNFSILGVGGFSEVFTLDDLNYIIPVGTIGDVEYSGNVIPISFTKGSGAVFSPDVLTLNSDNISSGRRRLGMLVYVRDVDQVYQYDVPNFEILWSAATGATGVGGNTVIISDFGTQIKNNTTEGQDFINAWTASTIEGISGSTRANSNWKKYYGNNLSITGGTYNSITGTLNLVNITGGTVPIPGFGSGGGGGSEITGGTFDLTTGTLTLSSSGGTIPIDGFLYGTGTTETIPKYLTTSGFTSSQIYDDGTTVSIGTSPSEAAAILEVASTSQGVLFPRMTQTQRTSITSPPVGLIVYQTDGSDGMYIYKLSGWIQMI